MARSTGGREASNSADSMPGVFGPFEKSRPESDSGSRSAEEQLLAAVIASPDDDAPRLAYADWLDGHGHRDRARFIRLGCEPAAADDDRPELREQVDALLAAHQEAWSGALMPGAHEVTFHRGFPYFATLMLPAALPGEAGFVPDLLSAMDRAPIHDLRPIPFTPKGQDWENTALDPETREEWIGDQEPPDDEAHLLAVADRLATDPRMARLSVLVLDRATWGAGALRTLLQGPHWHGLETLAVGDGDSHVYAAEAIAASSSLKQLRELMFMGDSDADLGDEGAAVLAAAPQLASLRSLCLSTVMLGPAGAQALAASPHLTGLKELDLGGGSYNVNRIGPEGARAIAQAAFGRLSQLILEHNKIGDKGLDALANSRSLDAITFLSLSNNDIGDAGLRSLAEGRGMPQLSTLMLTRNRAITGDGVAALAGSGRFRGLKSLWLWGCPDIGPRGAVAIARSPHSTGLRSLYLEGFGIGPEGAKALAESPHLDGLEILDLGGSAPDDESRGLLRARFGDRLRRA